MGFVLSRRHIIYAIFIVPTAYLIHVFLFTVYSQLIVRALSLLFILRLTRRQISQTLAQCPAPVGLHKFFAPQNTLACPAPPPCAGGSRRSQNPLSPKVVSGGRQHIASFPAPRKSENRESDVSDTFAHFRHAKKCGVSSLDLHIPFTPLCPDRASVLAAMSGGGRAGYDTPYIPRGCDMRWYTSEEVCEILSRFSHIFFMGDSIMRLVNNAFYILLREDIGLGAIAGWDFKPVKNWYITTKTVRECMCNAQFENGACSHLAISNYEYAIGNTSTSLVCKAGTLDLSYHALIQQPLSEDDLTAMTHTVSSTRPPKPYVFLYHHGFWNNMDLPATEKWIDEIDGALRQHLPWLRSKNAFFPRLFLSANAAGPNKPPEWVWTQGNVALMKREKELESVTAVRRMELLGLYNMSVQARIPDGTHADMKTNLIKAMMVLNWLDHLDTDQFYKSAAAEEEVKTVPAPSPHKVQDTPSEQAKPGRQPEKPKNVLEKATQAVTTAAPTTSISMASSSPTVPQKTQSSEQTEKTEKGVAAVMDAISQQQETLSSPEGSKEVEKPALLEQHMGFPVFNGQIDENALAEDEYVVYLDEEGNVIDDSNAPEGVVFVDENGNEVDSFGLPLE
ncbi:hypothetical protein MRB53_040365 [Persea americana]|nr:hypothetical protein MRB53_040365 [Persea americana]